MNSPVCKVLPTGCRDRQSRFTSEVPKVVEATGRGVNTAAPEAMRQMRLDPRKATAAVQDLGNVGSISA